MGNMANIKNLLQEASNTYEDTFGHGEKIGVDHFPDGEPEEPPIVTFQISFQPPKHWEEYDEGEQEYLLQRYLEDANHLFKQVNVTFIE